MADYNWGLIMILYVALGLLIRRNLKDHKWQYWLDPMPWIRKNIFGVNNDQ